MSKNEKLEAYFQRHDNLDGLKVLRRLLQESDLVEEVKWGGPCYTNEGRNVIGLAAFKSHIALWFHQGALMDDPDDVLINAQEGKTKAMRQWRFDLAEKVPVTRVRKYIRAAIKNDREGRRVAVERSSTVDLVPELELALKDKKLAAAFNKLAPGKQREYANHIGEAKRAETRAKRVDKAIPLILEGKGLNDKYRS